ncbi:MAG: endolytic transglycosylase MltG [Spirochaetia bacterium]|nr:endolytic transglycosylase MltG [Spirochaetia bacterium]
MKFLNNKLIRILLVAGATLLIAGGLFAMLGPGSSTGSGDRKVTLEIEPGTGVKKLTEKLSEEKLIRNPAYFRFLMRFTSSGQVKAGIYEIDDGMSAGRIISMVTSGKVKLVSVTVPEGWNNRQIAAELVRRGLAKTPEEFLRLTEDPIVLKKYNIPAKTTEGYLFPETYSVPIGYPLASFQEQMLKQFFRKIKDAEPPEGLTADQLHEKVILASIVEREAVRRDELAIMAQVFLNRLDKRMRLESCATVQYLFDKPHKKLYDRDLEIQSPYNTYLHRGLPPGPISSPGIPALKAAFHPTATDTLFFVLKPDGSHHFSKTFKEHNQAKEEFLGGRRI